MHGQEMTIQPLPAASEQAKPIEDQQGLKLIQMIRELKATEKVADEMARYERQKLAEGQS
jgi:hypothetical protein